MPNAIIMPKMGNSVESCIIVDWKKAVGDVVAQGDTLCEVETDKAVMEVESTESGTLLGVFFDVGDEVPVQTNIAAVGEPGEDFGALDPNFTAEAQKDAETAQVVEVVSVSAVPAAGATAPSSADPPEPHHPNAISPRARNLAQRKGLDASSLVGSGPAGRVIERDVQAALVAQPKLTPVARAMVGSGGFESPESGSGPGGRVMSRDLVARGETPTSATVSEQPLALDEPKSGDDGLLPADHVSRFTHHADEIETIPVKGVRRVIAQRMLASLQTTAQLTLNASADARAILAYRKRLKASPEALGVQSVTINDLILFAVSRTLTQYPGLNALFEDEAISQYSQVHLGVAVDTPRGLMVPTVRHANALNLRQLAAEAKRLAMACIEGRILPDELTGGTFTVTNLGAFGVENFTPVLNPPQVGILGVGNINLKPIQVDDEVEFVPHIGLSLTINHQVVDGAPAARFLQTLAQGIGEIDLLLAM